MRGDDGDPDSPYRILREPVVTVFGNDYPWLDHADRYPPQAA
jgi:hypothetical protein